MFPFFLSVQQVSKLFGLFNGFKVSFSFPRFLNYLPETNVLKVWGSVTMSVTKIVASKVFYGFNRSTVNPPRDVHCCAKYTTESIGSPSHIIAILQCSKKSTVFRTVIL